MVYFSILGEFGPRRDTKAPRRDTRTRNAPLDQISSILGIKSQQKVDLVDIPRVQANGMSDFRFRVFETQIFVRQLRRPRELRRSCKSEQQQIQDQSIKLEHERRELQPPHEAVTIRVHHVLVRAPALNESVAIGSHATDARRLQE